MGSTKVFVMLHKWRVYDDHSQDVIAVFKDEASAINGFGAYMKDIVEGGDYFASEVLDENLQRKDIRLARFSFDEMYYRAESKSGDLFDEIWVEVHSIQ